MKLVELKKCKIAIWGFGIEGQATADYLTQHSVEFKVLCKKSESSTRFACITEQVDIHMLNNFDVIIKSPGISAYNEIIKKSKARFISATALWFANEKETKVIVITGTKGKSTTSSLIAHVLNKVGKTVNLVGNIGKPLILSSSNYDYIVMEASSFQIYDGEIQPDIAVVLNLYAEHLDWHKGEENYFNDKLMVLNNARVKIINKKNLALTRLLESTSNADNLSYFNDNNDYTIIDESIFLHNEKLVSLNEIQLLGVHNLENILAVLSVCEVLSIDRDLVIDAIKFFKPLAHRLQNLGKIGKHFAINDSIATTPMATIAALNTVDTARTTLLIGGFDRGHDWSFFVDELCKVKPHLIIIAGENAQILVSLFAHSTNNVAYLQADDLKHAIELAQNRTPVGGTILLSPGAPSFDLFESYIKRGEFFEYYLKQISH